MLSVRSVSFLLVLLVPSLLTAEEAPRGEPSLELEDLVGHWEGRLAFGAVNLRMVVTLRQVDGRIVGDMDSPDQGMFDLPLSQLFVEGSTFSFRLPSANGEFQGVHTVVDGGEELQGTWNQGLPLPLTLARVDEPTRLVRPQEPKPPFPYEVREVTFDHAWRGEDAPEITLAGTLTVPRGEGPHPALVLVSGSGPQDRDESLFGHRPFLVLADDLTRAGIAVLRYDDRGMGASTGDFAAATLHDFVDDLRSACHFLEGLAEIDDDRIGALGHSEGGIVVPAAAAKGANLAVAVLLAGPAVAGGEVIIEQSELISRAMLLGSDRIERNRRYQERLFAAVQEGGEDEELADRLRGILGEMHDAMSEPEKRMAAPDRTAFVEGQVAQLTSPWFRTFLLHDPTADLRALRCPTLALWGSRDLQVPPAQSLPPMADALRENPDVTLCVLPSLNHLLQTARTGAPAEYGLLEETMAPLALDTIRPWLVAKFGVDAKIGR